MSATMVDIHEAQTRLPQLLTFALKGSEVVITQDNIPLVRLVPVQQPSRQRVADLHQGAMQMHTDFGDPLPDEFWLGTK